LISVAKVNVSPLDDALTKLRSSGPFDAHVLKQLEAFICTSDDAALYRMNPLVLADELGLPGPDTVRLFLHGAKSGLLTMHWELVCPHCGDIVQSFSALGKVTTHFDCRICSVAIEADLDDYVAVSFNVVDSIRPNRLAHPETLEIDDYLGVYRFAHAGKTLDGQPYRSVFMNLARGAAFVEPNTTQEFSFELEPGGTRIFDFAAESGLAIPVRGERAHAVQTVDIHFGAGGPRSVTTQLAPGPVLVRLHGDDRRRPCSISHFPHGWTMPPRVKDPLLTGKLLLNSPTFRRLFGAELIETASGLHIRDLTFLFTDLKGSTELYERVGDVRAFQLVSEHFQELDRVIAAHQGTIVKTIGDAVMATFMTPLDATLAALAMLDVIAAYNRQFGRDEVVLKIGIHAGAAIAVTQNDRLDYFGQTVNIAARVQGLAAAEEICVTEDVRRAPGLDELCARLHVASERAMIKGLSDRIQVYRLRPKAAKQAA